MNPSVFVHGVRYRSDAMEPDMLRTLVARVALVAAMLTCAAPAAAEDTALLRARESYWQEREHSALAFGASGLFTASVGVSTLASTDSALARAFGVTSVVLGGTKLVRSVVWMLLRGNMVNELATTTSIAKMRVSLRQGALLSMAWSVATVVAGSLVWHYATGDVVRGIAAGNVFQSSQTLAVDLLDIYWLR